MIITLVLNYTRQNSNTSKISFNTQLHCHKYLCNVKLKTYINVKGERVIIVKISFSGFCVKSSGCLLLVNKKFWYLSKIHKIVSYEVFVSKVIPFLQRKREKLM